MTSAFDFDVALSFAGEDREVARVIGEIAQANGLRVFVDEFYVQELWGRNLVEELEDIYARRAHYCLILISEAYCRKPYTNAERRFALDRAIREREEYILPVVLDDSWPPGLPRSTSILDLRRYTPQEVGAILVRKLKPDTAEPVSPSPAALAPKVRQLPLGEAVLGPQDGSSPVRFAAVDLAPECHAWKQRQPWRFDAGIFEDPTFDITLVNRGDEPVLLTAVGVEFLAARTNMLIMGGGASSDVVHLHRIYRLELPDVWAALAAAEKASPPASGQLSAIRELAYCRLPDPVLMQGQAPYRYGLDLFDYPQLCPDYVELCFWIRTDAGEFRSPRASLHYLLPGSYGGVVRYARIKAGEGDREQNERLKPRPLD